MAKSNANTKKVTPVAPASPEKPATNPATDEAVTAQDNQACQDPAPDADQTETNCEGGATASPEKPVTNPATDEAVTAQDNPTCQDPAPDADQTETNCEGGATASPEKPATNPAADEAVTAQDNQACQDPAPDADQTETNCEGGATASPEKPVTNPATDEAVTAQDNPTCQDPAPDADQTETNCEGGATAEDTLSSLEAEAAKFVPGTYYQDCVDADKVRVMSSVISGVLAGRGSARDDLNNEHYRQRLVDNAELVADEVIRRCTYSRKVEPACSDIASALNS